MLGKLVLLNKIGNRAVRCKSCWIVLSQHGEVFLHWYSVPYCVYYYLLSSSFLVASKASMNVHLVSIHCCPFD